MGLEDLTMEVFHGLEDLERDPASFSFIVASFFLNPFEEFTSSTEFHDDLNFRKGLEAIMEADDVRMIQKSEAVQLVLEVLQEILSRLAFP